MIDDHRSVGGDGYPMSGLRSSNLDAGSVYNIHYHSSGPRYAIYVAHVVETMLSYYDDGLIVHSR